MRNVTRKWKNLNLPLHLMALKRHRSAGALCAASMKINPQYVDGLKLSVIAQILLGLFALMVLDGGQLFVYWVAFTAVYWVLTVVLIYRRPESPTDTDITFVKYGYGLVFGISLLLHYGV